MASYPKNQSRLEFLKPNTPVLQDLGFFDQMHFKYLHEHGVYFIARWQSQIGVHDPHSRERIQLAAVTEELTEHEAALAGHMGYTARMPVL